MVGSPVKRGMSHGKREEVRRTKDPDRENRSHLDIPAPWTAHGDIRPHTWAQLSWSKLPR